MSPPEFRRLREEYQLQALLEWSRKNQPENWDPFDPLYLNPKTRAEENKLGTELRDAIAAATGFDEEALVKMMEYGRVDLPPHCQKRRS
jgi:hypothetical protein